MKSLEKRIGRYIHLKKAYEYSDLLFEYLQENFPEAKIKYDGIEVGHGCSLYEEDISFNCYFKYKKQKFEIVIKYVYNQDKKLDYTYYIHFNDVYRDGTGDGPYTNFRTLKSQVKKTLQKLIK